MADALEHPAEIKDMVPSTSGIGLGLGAIGNLSTGWGVLPSTAGQNFLYWSGSIDLSAYLLKELTWVTTGRAIQEPGNFTFTFATPQTVEFIEFITNTPISRAQLTNVLDDWEITNSVPGMLGSQVDFQNVIMGRWRQFSTDSTLATGSAVTLKTEEFGSGEPSASERLYTYNIMKFSTPLEGDDTFFIPNRRMILAGAGLKESDYEYIYRLRRSYVLQESVV